MQKNRKEKGGYVVNSEFSDLKDKANDILSHHGIKNQQWGVRNGPPYPLDSDGKKSFREQLKKRKAEKRKKKIMNDPNKITKHADMFTEEELRIALDKLRLINEYKKEVGLTKLSSKKKKMANTPGSLLKNLDKYSPEEYKAAIDRLNKREKIKNMLVDSTDRPTKIVSNIASGIGSVQNTAFNISKMADTVAKYSGSLTSDEKHKTWLEKNKPKDDSRNYATILGTQKLQSEGRHSRSEDLDSAAEKNINALLKKNSMSQDDRNNLASYMQFLYGNSNSGKGKGKGK